ncbi:GtrA family protein [Mesorhizobium sp. WSM4884]|uniref:GtrA family protein n=1 Tax=Mesorhizobium sp. WSM4884 TaxID=3038542 RepID=UPI0024172C9D|nr:GtrA family protein [Mesorhizobium sp. WSM4884]MDG4881168.1 GtrA family protein [Mesorhizobium sp. WSM4884]
MQPLRFGVAGVANTALGYTVILLGLAVGLGDVVSNALGYAVGLALSYALNSRWTFRRDGSAKRLAVLKYFLTFVVAYSANLAIILYAQANGQGGNPAVHLVAISVYTALFYLGSATFVFGTRKATTRRYWPEGLVAISLVVSWALMLRIPLSHDVIWQMWIARQLIGGAKLYVDVLELNPPLWFWMGVPVERMAQFFGVTTGAAVVTAVVSFVAIAVTAVGAMISDESTDRRALLLSAAAVSMLLIPLADFAQREHLALIGALPYAILIARRADGAAVSFAVAAVVGALAAVSFALKHYFLLAPLLLELWLIFRLRRAWRPLRPETMVLGVAAAVYAVALLVLTPEYLRTIVPMLQVAYDGYNSRFLAQLLTPYVVIWGYSAVVFVHYRKHVSSVSLAAGLAAAGFVLAYFVQQKGFRYHAIPATGLAFFGLCTMLDFRERAVASAIRRAVIVAVASMPVLLAAYVGPYSNLNQEPILALLQKTKPGSPVLMLTANPSNIWPMIEDRGLVWPSRHFAFWMTIAMAKQLKTTGGLSPALQVLADDVRTQTVDDLMCNPPDMILVDDLSRSKAGTFNLVDFFSENEDFRQFFSHYDRGEVSENFTAYTKREGWQPEKKPNVCRKIS